MSRKSIGLDDALHQYTTDVTVREPDIFRRLREETSKLESANMQIAPEQGQFMAFLCEALGARRALEVGTFTGYSALWIAQALPPEGQLICCDVSVEWTNIARRYWTEAGFADRIELRLAPALNTLGTLVSAADAPSTFDFIFLDAEKHEYDAYYEHSLILLRRGGIVAIDNAYAGGRVLDLDNPEHETAKPIDALNRKLHADERVSTSLVPIGDGLLLARKR